MAKVNFKRGEFLTHINNPKMFAIYGGEELPYRPEDGGKTYYSLICYYNPNQTTKNQFNNWVVYSVFDADVDNKGCLYTISDADAAWWRRMNETEKGNAIKFLAEKKKLAYDPLTMKLRKMGPNEVLKFGPPPAQESNIVDDMIGGFRNFTRIGGRHGHSNNKHVNRTATYESPKITIQLTVPDGYKQKKKIKGLTNRMVKSIKAAVKIENKKTKIYNSSCYPPYRLGYSDGYDCCGYGSEDYLPFYDD